MPYFAVSVRPRLTARRRAFHSRKFAQTNSLATSATTTTSPQIIGRPSSFRRNRAGATAASFDTIIELLGGSVTKPWKSGGRDNLAGCQISSLGGFGEEY